MLLLKQLRLPAAVVAQAVNTLAGTNPLSPLPGKALVETGSFLGTSTSIFPMSVDEEM